MNDAFDILKDFLKTKGFKLEAEDWSLFLRLYRAKYFIGTFSGNDCNMLTNNIENLMNLLIKIGVYHFIKPLIETLEAFKKVQI